MKRQAIQFSPHLDRYVYATHACQNRATLDLGGKSGYGADILSYTTNNKVTIADHMPGELKRVKPNHDKILIDFNDGFPEGMWDAMVAFEIIEHVINPDKFIQDITEHLNPDGVLVFSVPHMKECEDHLTLFDEQDIKKLISKYLTIEEFYVQDSYNISGKKFEKYPVTYVGVARKK